jgi:hypothetical protein
MLEVHIAQQPGETMSDVRGRVRSFCEANRIPFEQAGQVPQALAIFVADEGTREAVQQGLAVPIPSVVATVAEAEAVAPVLPAKQAEVRDPTRRETLRPSRS